MKTEVLLLFRRFYEIIVAEHGVCDHDLRREVRILVKKKFSIVAFNRFNYNSR